MEEEIPKFEIMVCLHLVTIFGLVHVVLVNKETFHLGRSPATCVAGEIAVT